MDIKQFKTDKAKEEEGIWEDLGEGCSVLVARWGNPKMQKEYQRYPRTIRTRIEGGQASDAQADEIMSSIIAKTVLLDWKGLKEDEQEVEFSAEEAKRILQDYPDFRTIVFEISTTASHYHEESVETSVKNSKRGSSGS